jgi:hypothetical protein
MRKTRTVFQAEESVVHVSSFSPSFCLTVLVHQQAGLTAMINHIQRFGRGRRGCKQFIYTLFKNALTAPIISAYRSRRML